MNYTHAIIHMLIFLEAPYTKSCDVIIKAIKEGKDLVHIQAQIQPNIDLNLSSDGKLPLTEAIKARRPSVVELLIRHGADPNLPDQHRDVPLQVALDNDSPLNRQSIIKTLVTHGACVDTVFLAGHSPEIISLIKPSTFEAENINNQKSSQSADIPWTDHPVERASHKIQRTTVATDPTSTKKEVFTASSAAHQDFKRRTASQIKLSESNSYANN